MKPYRICILFFFLLLSCSSVFSQDTDEQLANQYYQNKEFDKAVVYYEKLFGQSENPIYYDFYLNCLFELKDFKKAEKVAKKQIKQNPNDLQYAVDLGVVYQKSDQPEKAKKEFEKAIKQLQPDQDQILKLADAFVKIKEYDYAIETYKKGRKLFQGIYPFNFELAEVYYQKGDVTSMINEYLDALEISDSYIQSVQNALQTSFGNDADNKKNEILKTELLKRIQNDPDKSIFSELLIWMQIQQRDYEGAFIQIRALDKRNKEDGTRMMSFAQACVENESYDLAEKAYQYVITKGNNNYYYQFAKMDLINVSYKKITVQNNYTQNDLVELEKNFKTLIDEFGKTTNTIPVLKNMAHLQAFYMNKTGDAMNLLEEIIDMPAIQPLTKAECKLELGDILLMKGDVWEASLKYSQVEKAFKYDPIGQEAKFRNAKISYYTGDFKWAQAQLDVLKGATSKLISNDAMALSLVISDNLAVDTNTTPLLMFARAELLSFQNKDDEAVTELDSISRIYPNHALADDILYKKSEIMIKHGKYEDAGKYLEELIAKYSNDILADDALFKLAELNETKFHNTDKAKELYEKLLTDFPGSLYTVEARKRFRRLRGDVVVN